MFLSNSVGGSVNLIPWLANSVSLHCVQM